MHTNAHSSAFAQFIKCTQNACNKSDAKRVLYTFSSTMQFCFMLCSVHLHNHNSKGGRAYVMLILV